MSYEVIGSDEAALRATGVARLDAAVELALEPTLAWLARLSARAVRRMMVWKRSTPRTRLVAGASLVLAMSGCTMGARCQDMQFARLRPADRVLITTNMNETLRTISDPASVAALVSFAEAHASDWEVPWYGPPGALVRANFYAGNRFLGDLGVGNTFLTAQGCGDFHSRPVSAADRAVVMQMFGVQDPYARAGR